MDKLFIIHFSPLELYPPVQNFINTLVNKTNDKKIFVITTSSTNGELERYESPSTHIRILRLGKSGLKISKWVRIYFYLYFYLGGCLLLLLKRPSGVLYYETISSFPAYFYKRFINRQAAIMVHYHEYTTPKEYDDGMYLTKLFHQYEKWLYPRLKWFSHTNSTRMDFFLKDVYPVVPCNPMIVPNYPPANWKHVANKKWNFPYRLVYVGALSMDTIYTREIVEWVINQQGKVFLDIFSYNATQAARDYINKLGSDYVQIKDGVNYPMLPSTIKQYDTGLILYKGHSLNYEYNAPNKLFEYLMLGLNVWYPLKLKYIHEFEDSIRVPKVIGMDFENLQFYKIESLVHNDEMERRDMDFTCEAATYMMAKTYLA